MHERECVAHPNWSDWIVGDSSLSWVIVVQTCTEPMGLLVKQTQSFRLTRAHLWKHVNANKQYFSGIIIMIITIIIIIIRRRKDAWLFTN